MQVRFQLVPQDEEWRNSESWLVHTDGRVYIEGGKECLLEVINEKSSAHLAMAGSEGLCGVHTYVGELLLTLIAVAPYALEPVPLTLHHYLSVNGLPNFFRSWTEWLRAADYRFEPDDPIWNEHDLATRWLADRVLDCDYLPGRPRVWLWCDGQEVHWGWDFSQSNTDARSVYTATQGMASEPADMFKQSLADFGIALFNEIERSSVRPMSDAREAVLDSLYIGLRKKPNTNWLRVQAAMKRAAIW